MKMFGTKWSRKVKEILNISMKKEMKIVNYEEDTLYTTN